MPFRPPKKQPEFADLKGILAQYKDQDNALYQTVQEIIERLTQLKLVQNEVIAGKLDDGTATLKFASKFPTYHTKDNETALLPNSWQLLAGTGIAFDDTTPNQRVIKATGSGGGGVGGDVALHRLCGGI